MTFKEFKQILDAQYKQNKGGDIIFYLDEVPLEIESMGRFTFVPDITIRFQKIKRKKPRG